MSKVWVLQHTEKETLGRISEALERRGMDFHYIRSFMGQPVPREMGDAVGLILLADLWECMNSISTHIWPMKSA